MIPTVSRRRHVPGTLVAGATALVSGVSVFVNSYGMQHFSSPAVYTTMKNLVAALFLGAGALIVPTARGAAARPCAPDNGTARRVTWRHRAGFAYVGVVGGGVSFVLFFDGLARTPAVPAAFLHDTLVLFVALLAWPALRERLSGFNLAVIGLLVAGEVLISGGVGNLGLGDGPLLVLGATVLWAIETVVAKRLLAGSPPRRVALTRMGVGAIVLVTYVAVTGHLDELASLDRVQIKWALLTGLLLAAYVATWFVALARVRAVDVTSVLVGSVVVTALLEEVAGKSLGTSTYLGSGVVVVASLGLRWIWPRQAPA